MRLVIVNRCSGKIQIQKMQKINILKIILIIVTTFFLLVWVKRELNVNKYPELDYLKNNNLSFVDLTNYFKKVAVDKGAAYAFDVLRVATFPPNTDIHLLAHSVGDILYKQRGVDGIKICTQEFRNACSHSIVIGVLINKGIGALSEIANACKSAPGGSGAYGMCFHGLGHGILAYAGYDMRESVKLCQKLGTNEHHQIETMECVGGVMMEMVGGVHDKTAWEKQKNNYLKKEDPLFPCNQDFIPSIAKVNCYNYITPHLWEVAGANISHPTDSDLANSFAFCSKLTGSEAVYKDACYGGFGKEFIALAQSRDIRKISEMTQDQLKKVYDWCSLAGNIDGVVSCVSQAVNSLYWGGENKPDVAVAFCGVIKDDIVHDSCMNQLIGNFKYYNSNHQKVLKLCSLLPETYKQKCSKN